MRYFIKKGGAWAVCNTGAPDFVVYKMFVKFKRFIDWQDYKSRASISKEVDNDSRSIYFKTLELDIESDSVSEDENEQKIHTQQLLKK